MLNVTFRRGERYRARRELPFAPRGAVLHVIRSRLDGGRWLVELREDPSSVPSEPLFPRDGVHFVPLEDLEALKLAGALRLARAPGEG